MREHYPTVVRRYAATFIDAGFLLLFLLMIATTFQGQDQSTAMVRVAAIASILLLYEPVCTRFFCTLGQLLTGIRVRMVHTHEKVPLPLAYLRVVVKILLGWYSFFSILFSEKKRALHDYASGTIVLTTSYLASAVENAETSDESTMQVITEGS